MMRVWQNCWFVLLMQVLTFWPVWSWYVARMSDRSDEPWGIAALATAGLLVLRKGVRSNLTGQQLGVIMVVTALYLLSYSFTPPLAKALLANLAIGCTLSACTGKRGLHSGLIGLLVLSLPVIASLQFYAGYPIRVCTAYLAAQLIRLGGQHVVADGTMLLWFGERVAVDAPCAGIRMLWVGLYLSFTLASFSDFSVRQTWTSYTCASLLLFFGNVLRNSILFFLEAGLLPLPASAHTTIGVIVFCVVALGIVLANRSIQQGWLLQRRSI